MFPQTNIAILSGIGSTEVMDLLVRYKLESGRRNTYKEPEAKMEGRDEQGVVSFGTQAIDIVESKSPLIHHQSGQHGAKNHNRGHQVQSKQVEEMEKERV